MTDSTGPLQGYHILDMTTVVLGPYAGQILGDLGADVIKVESPTGDIVRQTGSSPVPGFGALFMGLNRNKRSVALDLKRPEAREPMNALLEWADVLIHNIRGSAIDRLGYDYEAVKAVNPELIYVHAVGFGSNGPYADAPAYDDTVQAISGLTSLNSYLEEGAEPRYLPTLLCDKTTGLHVVYSVLAALLHRERTGQGQKIEVPMFESVVSFLMAEHLSGHIFRPPQGDIGYERLLHPQSKPFKTKDGFLAILPYTNQHWQEVLHLGDRLDLLDDPRMQTIASRRAHMAELYEIVQEILLPYSTQDLIDFLTKADIPFTKVNTLESLLEDEHLTATNFFEERAHPEVGAYLATQHPAQFSETPATIRREPPTLGQDGKAVLVEAGLDETQIEELIKQGILIGVKE